MTNKLFQNAYIFTQNMTFRWSLSNLCILISHLNHTQKTNLQFPAYHSAICVSLNISFVYVIEAYNCCDKVTIISKTISSIQIQSPWQYTKIKLLMKWFYKYSVVDLLKLATKVLTVYRLIWITSNRWQCNHNETLNAHVWQNSRTGARFDCGVNFDRNSCGCDIFLFFGISYSLVQCNFTLEINNLFFPIIKYTGVDTPR